MAVSDDLDVYGRWWFPGQEEDAVPGRLTFSVDAGGYLDLIEDLASVHTPGDDRPSWESGVYPYIHGESDDSEFTLVDCFQVSRPQPPMRGSERVRVTRVLANACMDPAVGMRATAATAQIRHLTHWMTLSGLRDEYPENGRSGVDGRWTTIHADRLSPITVDIPDGGRLTLEQSLGLDGDGVLERAATQRINARVDFTDYVEMEQLIREIGDFRDLISIAADDAAVFEQVDLWRPDVNDRGHLIGISLRAQWNDWSPAGDAIHPSLMAFNWSHVGEAGLKRWMALAAVHRRALARVMASRHRRGMFVSDRLLNRCAALESFDRERTEFSGSKFKSRMKRCVEFAGPQMHDLVGDVEIWAEVLRKERDDVAHHFGRGFEDGAQLLFLGDSVYWLFVMCMLTAAELPDAASRLADHRQLRWLKPRLHHILGLTASP